MVNRNTGLSAEVWVDGLQEHQQLGRLIESFDGEVEELIEGRTVHARRLADKLRLLLRHLIPHVREEEREGGLLDDLRGALPHRRVAIQALMKEHAPLIAELRALSDHLQGLKCVVATDVVARARRTMRRLARHEAAERDLIAEAAGAT